MLFAWTAEPGTKDLPIDRMSEPELQATSVVPAGHQAEVLELLGVLNRDHGKTIAMVTHDPQAAAAARRVLHLDKGRLIEDAAA